MVINYCGAGCFKIQTGGVTILTEGTEGDVSGRMKPDIFIKTTKNKVTVNAENSVLGSGEYEIKGVEITGFPNFVYFVKTEDIRMSFGGGGDDIDILFIEDSAEGAKIARQLGPKIIVSNSGSCENLEKELGKKAEALDKLVIKKKEVPMEQLSKLICLK